MKGNFTLKVILTILEEDIKIINPPSFAPNWFSLLSAPLIE
jgi:hypothetical protein